MKIRHAVIASIALFIATPIFSENYFNLAPQIQQTLTTIVVCLWPISLGLIAYLIIRNIFRAVKNAVTGVPQGDGYRDEARRACERITPKKNKDVTPPWEG